MSLPPYGKVIIKIGDNRWNICWRGIPMEAERKDGTWRYCYTNSSFRRRVYGQTPRKAAQLISREINIDREFRLVRWHGMYGSWYLYMGEGYSATVIKAWAKRPKRDELLATIALAKLEKST
jgi:hypothetical protein